jgi:ubiquinone/menaquinone biosynthesis C-methylase UbiE
MMKVQFRIMVLGFTHRNNEGEGNFMTIDFHDAKNRHTYTGRSADRTWLEWMQNHFDFQCKKVLELGCGGGIYSRGLAELGAAEVLGIDFSAEMVEAAKQSSQAYRQIRYRQGNALATGLDGEQFDFILERALIHHIADLGACFAEAYRLLAPGGVLLIQDRTKDDCLLPGSREHLRGYFFELYPRLIEKETGRRPDSRKVKQALEEAGFISIQEEKLWETRKTYLSAEELKQDLLLRKGRSILHELSDGELQRLADFVAERAVPHQAEKRQDRRIVERDVGRCG